jgi:hypothetical protein
MNTPDQDTIMRAVDDARRILGEYIAPGKSDAVRTLERLLFVLDNENVLRALDRMSRRKALRLVESPSISDNDGDGGQMAPST